MKNRGITLGCATGLFCPNDPVSRLSIAAFLQRLGDAVLPPSVLWVAPSGGTFQSIQAAINHAAGIASVTYPVLVKVAPGTYFEMIHLAPYVRVEGSGEALTTIQPATCSAPQPGAVVMANNSQIAKVSIQAGSCAAGILFDAGGALNVGFPGTAVQDVSILGNPSVGIWLRGAIGGVGPIERVTMNLQPGLGDIHGVFADLGPSFTLSSVKMRIAGATASVGVRMNGDGFAQLSGVEIDLAGPALAANNFGVDIAFGTVHVRDSIIRAVGTGVRTTGPAQALITNSGIRGVLSPVSGNGITCLFTYEPQLHTPVSC